MAKTVLLLSLLVVALFFGIGATLPESWHIETSMTIDAPAERILQQAQDLNHWSEWSTVQAAMGPNTDSVVEPPGVGAGAVLRWRGPEGEARLTVLEADPQRGLRYRFEVDGAGILGEGGLRFAPAGGATEVTWYDDGRLQGLLQRWLWKLGVGLEEAIAEHQATSLANLKLRVEGG